MEVINKYLGAITTELQSERRNLDKVVDLFKTTSELYAHTNVNLVNTILYPESSMSVKYPSDWYKPTATFRLTQTFTIQPVDGKFFLTFYPNLLFTKSNGGSSIEIISGGVGEYRTGTSGNTLGKTASEVSSFIDKYSPGGKFKDIATGLADVIVTRGIGILDQLLPNQELKEAIGKVFKDTETKNPGERKDLIENALEKMGVFEHNQNVYVEDNMKLYVEDNVIDHYRCNAAVVSVKGEDRQGVLFATSTYFNTSSPQIADEQKNRYMKDFSNFAQEWIYKMEENPALGVRVIKTPKDHSDSAFRIPNTNNNTEQVIMIAGKGLNSNGVLLIDVIQHIEFIPKLAMMDFFTPTIPMFGIGSKDILYKTTSNFPIIGANGSLIINSPKKIENIMNYIKRYKDSGYNMTLWNVLTDSSYINDKTLLEIVNDTFYK